MFSVRPRKTEHLRPSRPISNKILRRPEGLLRMTLNLVHILAYLETRRAASLRKGSSPTSILRTREVMILAGTCRQRKMYHWKREFYRQNRSVHPQARDDCAGGPGRCCRLWWGGFCGVV